MRTWVKVSLVTVAVAVLGFFTLAGTGAYFFFRELETRSGNEAQFKTDFDTVRAKYVGRPPLIEIANLQAGDFKINRTAHPEGRRAETVHILTWTADDQKLLRTNVPLWLMRFSSINILSHLGVAPEKFRLTAEDLARYGPGIVVDFMKPERSHVLIWVE
jgi:hypothetical protein